MFKNCGDRNHCYHLEFAGVVLYWGGQNDRCSVLIVHNNVLISHSNFLAQHRKLCVLRLQLSITVSCWSSRSVDIASTVLLVYRCSSEYTIKINLMHVYS